ncbi:CHASE3 domain-containing protein [Rariglobus hedericola]|nr:CHASE3 domain-containing protein [Rariglobus hedericola]
MKNSRPVLLSRPVVIIGLIIGVTLAAGTAILSTVSTREMAAASIRVTHTQATLLEINQLLSSLIDTETGQRGYILTGLESYLEPYTRAADGLDKQLDGLRQRFANSPEQLATLDRISQLVADKKAETSRTIELRRANAIGPALHIVDSGAGLKNMNALRMAVHDLEQRELMDLSLNSASVSRRADFFQIIGLIMLVAACAMGGTGGWLLMRRVHELETMITVCAWTRRVKFNGQWVSFEDYLRARFNLQFTHGISEEASRKLKMEAIELVEAEALKYKGAPVVRPA